MFRFLSALAPKQGATLAESVLDFAALQGDNPFQMKDLTNHVLQFVETSPESPGRVLRRLKAKRELNYVLIDRQKSLYRFVRAA